MASKYTVKLMSPKTKERLMKQIYSGNLYERKAAIHGACLKFFTDSREFKDMWEDNFEPMPEWIRPHARLFCISDKKTKGLSIIYEPTSKTVIMKNCNYYGWVKSVGLALVADFFEDFTSEHRRYSIHGSFVDFGGRGLTIIGPSKSGKTTLTYGLLLDKEFNFITDDWFFVRLASNGTLVHSSEKNSYIGSDLADNWADYKPKLKSLKRDVKNRAVMEVSQVIGEDRIRQNSNLRLTVVLRREPGKELLKKLTPQEAVKYMIKHDFCNPHQLIRTKAKIGKRKAFFRELFKRAPVYLLNTIETPSESLARLKNLINEIDN
jgi:hypothetical protein